MNMITKEQLQKIIDNKELLIDTIVVCLMGQDHQQKNWGESVCRAHIDPNDLDNLRITSDECTNPDLVSISISSVDEDGVFDVEESVNNWINEQIKYQNYLTE